MSDLKDRVGVITNGNANLIKDPGDLITGDGEQCVYLRNPNVGGASDGFALVLDSSVEEGIGWAPVAGGLGLTDVTGSDGVTVTSPTVSTRNVTNDLVTGVDVAQLNVDSLDKATIDAPVSGPDKGIVLTAGSTQLKLGNGAGSGTSRAELIGATVRSTASAQVDATAPVILLTGSALGDSIVNLNDDGIAIGIIDPTAEGIIIDASGTLTVPIAGTLQLRGQDAVAINTQDGDITVIADGTVANGDLTLSSDRAGTGTTDLDGATTNIKGRVAVNVSPDDGASVTVTTGTTGDLIANINHDETHTIGRNFTLTAAGAGGVSIAATIGNTTIDAGSVDNTGEVRIMPTVGAPAATKTFRIWDGAGAGQATVATPGGGAVIDAECRQSLSDLLDAMLAWGWLSAAP